MSKMLISKSREKYRNPGKSFLCRTHIKSKGPFVFSVFHRNSDFDRYLRSVGNNKNECLISVFDGGKSVGILVSDGNLKTKKLAFDFLN